ncbi:MAG TPA: low molecular weight protein arginine phosphatase, partial [Verrucomicrobiota bacterium]|nr:low molecular weight protein arginine phosphatase [Verrucomicrobiota bacterium]
MKTLLFICTGNVCRSPMAEALFRHITQGRGDYVAMSAGICTIDGQPPSQNAIDAM